MSSVLKTYNLFLDSSQRDSSSTGTPASFSLFLSNPISKSVKSSTFRVKIVQACIPFSFTEINNSNNLISYSYNGTPFTFTIPVGSYNINSLLLVIKDFLEASHSISLDFTFNASTNLATLAFSGSNTGTLDIVIPTTGGNEPVMKQLGFVDTTVVFSFVFGNPNVYSISNQSVNVSPSKNIYIRSNNLLQPNSQEAIITKCRPSNILGIIPINVPFGNYINFYNTQTFGVDIGNETIDFIDVFLSDSNNSNVIVGLLLNWTITIQIEEIYINPEISTDHILNSSISLNNKKSIEELENVKQNTLSDLEQYKGKLLNEIGEIHTKKTLKDKGQLKPLDNDVIL
jgi:hypothetical protein